MDLLPPLNSLPDLNKSSSPGDSTAVTVGKVILGAATGIPPSKVPSLQSIVVIILGLLLIAAGIFAFKEVRQTVITTGKTAAKVAMV